MESLLLLLHPGQQNGDNVMRATCREESTASESNSISSQAAN
jgi:hypothetical protein